MHRFFCPNTDFKDRDVEITDPKELHHLKNVLRLKKGSTVTLLNGSGKETHGIITAIEKNTVRIKIEKREAALSTPRFTVTLACAIPKKSKFETILEKSTELGVDEIVPLYTQRTEVMFKAADVAKKLTRYRTIIINAAKQSQRKNLPNLHPPAKFKDYLFQLDSESTVLIPCLISPRKKISDIFKDPDHPPQKLVFLIGPEGDFTPEEVRLAVSKGGIPVSLGPTVLKVDTAAIAVLACTNLFFRI
jgi:16S rRNA (uracil1498-N3)-methyltransferase